MWLIIISKKTRAIDSSCFPARLYGPIKIMYKNKRAQYNTLGDMHQA